MVLEMLKFFDDDKDGYLSYEEAMDFYTFLHEDEDYEESDDESDESDEVQPEGEGDHHHLVPIIFY